MSLFLKRNPRNRWRTLFFTTGYVLPWMQVFPSAENNKIDITLVLFLRRELYNLANGYFCVGGFHTGYQRGKILQYFCKELFFIRQLCRLRLLLRLLLLSHAHALEANREFQ